MQAEIITIGDEILIGQIVDTNSAWMAKKLNEIGIHVKQISSVADDVTDIVVALTMASTRADLILLTGGLGPTKDDVTKQALSFYFDSKIRRDPEVLAHVTAIFEKYNRPMLEMNKQQADVLEKAEVLFNQMGTAPGMWLMRNEKRYAIIPGVPFEMEHLMTTQVIPRLKQEVKGTPIVHHTILTAGIGESFLAKKIEGVESSLPPHMHLAYLPKPGSVRLRITATGHGTSKLASEIQHYFSRIEELIGEHYMANEDTNLEQVALDLLQTTNSNLSVAESCTGGDIARLITSLAGSSSVFEGGAVVYSNPMKIGLLNVSPTTLEKHGAVSEQTVLEMAAGAQKNFKTDYAIAVSGIAGPGGATPEKPVGLVWIGIAGKKGIMAKSFQFGENRLVNIARASAAALYLLINTVKSENPPQ